MRKARLGARRLIQDELLESEGERKAIL